MSTLQAALAVKPTLGAQLQSWKEQTEFKWVGVGEMFVAPYGRELSMPKVQRLRENWDTRAVGVIYLSERKVKTKALHYAILDGHHRQAAASAEGIFDLPSLVYQGLSYPDEARLYVEFATVNVQTALDRFKARLAAGEEKAEFIQHLIVEVAHLEVATKATGTAPNIFNAIYTLERIANEFGNDLARQMMEILYAAWGESYFAWRERMLIGVSSFLARYREDARFNEAHLVARLKTTTPEALQARAALIAVSLSRTNIRSTMGMALLQVYNDGRSGANLPDWQLQRYGMGRGGHG